MSFHLISDTKISHVIPDTIDIKDWGDVRDIHLPMNDVYIKNFIKFISIPNRPLAKLKDIRLVQFVDISTYIGSESLINLFTDEIINRLDADHVKTQYENLEIN